MQSEPELSELPASEDEKCITPTTVVDDVDTVFTYDGDKIYEPNNYHEQYNGHVTVRYALEHSLNVPTIKLAEAIGYDKVADLAKRSGLNAKIKGYPSVALGAFEVTPLEMAGAYTIFANEGKRLEPHALTRVVAANGQVLHRYKYTETQVAFASGRLPDDVPHGRCHPAWHGGECPFAWIRAARGRQDWHVSRWVVCRLHKRLHRDCLGWIR